MSTYTVAISWERGSQPFIDDKYSRRHTWRFDGGIEIPGSSSPLVVPTPYSDSRAVDPEEAFVASLSSCHMLWFLSIAARNRYCVDRYTDDAVGTMARNAAGKLAMTRVTLRPHVTFTGDRMPTPSKIDAMHHEAHDECFIANSVTTEVSCEPVHGRV
jgi:organic hydroperoxide reductase OsmC/OhrA